jgi:hypothetical protein
MIVHKLKDCTGKKKLKAKNISTKQKIRIHIHVRIRFFNVQQKIRCYRQEQIEQNLFMKLSLLQLCYQTKL